MIPHLILYAFAAFGFCVIVGFANITARPRMWLSQVPHLRKKGEPAVMLPIPPTGEYDADVYELVEDVPPLLPLRIFLVELISCPMCLGWWVGLVASFMVPLELPGNVLQRALLLAFFTSGVNWTLGIATKLIRI